MAEVTNNKSIAWWSHARFAVVLMFVTVICISAGRDFKNQWDHDAIYPSPAITNIMRLSQYHSGLSVTPCNTEVYVFRGQAPGGKVLILGGTHPNEPAGYLGSVVLVENLQITKGSVFVATPANASGFSATEPQEASPETFAIRCPNGYLRRFRYGSRFTSPLDGWPDPDVYLHYPSGQVLSGNETRNLNRAYPGRPDGSLTEQIAYGITELIKKEQIDLVIDLHEASPEYPVVNAIVFHERARDLAAMAAYRMQIEGIDITLEPSPPNFHGLSHRELGDATDAFVVLMETACVAQGRLRGKTSAELILTGDDPNYHAAAKRGYVRVPYPEGGIPMEVRVGRHLSGILAFVEAMGEMYPDKSLDIGGIPTKAQIEEYGIGTFLAHIRKVR